MKQKIQGKKYQIQWLQVMIVNSLPSRETFHSSFEKVDKLRYNPVNPSSQVYQSPLMVSTGQVSCLGN